MKKTILQILIIVVVCLVIGFFVGMEYKAYQVRSILEEATEELSDIFTEPNQQNISTPEIQQDEYTIIERKIGDEVELATIKFKVISSEEKQIINVQYGTPKVAKEGTKFIVIDLEITNITEAPFYFLNDGFGILDNKERLFSQYNDTFSIGNSLNGITLSPDIKERGVFVYEIPQDSENYAMTIGKAGTNEAYAIVLK